MKRIINLIIRWLDLDHEEPWRENDEQSYSDRFLSNVNGMIRSDINIKIIKKSNGRLFLSKEKVIFDNLKDLGLYEYRKMNGVWIYVSNDYKESKGWFDDIEI